MQATVSSVEGLVQAPPHSRPRSFFCGIPPREGGNSPVLSASHLCLLKNDHVACSGLKKSFT